MSKQFYEENYKVYNYTLTTLCPVHIGNGEAVLPIEYYVDVKNKRVIIPDWDKILEENENLDESVFENLSKNLGKSLDKVLKSLGKNIEINERNWSYATSIATSEDKIYQYAMKEVESDKNSDNYALSQIKLALKTGDYKTYISGGSIKGALRTAWLYKQCCTHLLRDEHDKIEVIIRKTINQKTAEIIEKEISIAESRRNRKYDAENVAKFADENIAKHYLSGDQTQEGYNFALHNLFRLLQVKDSEPQSSEEVTGLVSERLFKGIIPVKTKGEIRKSDIKYPSFYKGPFFYEVVQAQKTFVGKILLDRMLLENNDANNILGWFPDQFRFSLETLCEATNLFAKDICEWELNYFSSFPQDPKCDIQEIIKFYKELQEKINNCPANTIYLSLGHGSGWHKLTIGMLLENDPSWENWQRLADRLGIIDRIDKLDRKYPETRKLPMSSETSAITPFGWVKIEFAEQKIDLELYKQNRQNTNNYNKKPFFRNDRRK